MDDYFEILLPNRNKNAHRIIGYKNPHGCWFCTTLCKDSDGYVKIHIHGKDTRLHRVVYEAFNGTVPDNLFVMHNCDNPGCCNPDHLEAGTAAENNLHKKELGREGNTMKRLTTQEKDEISKSSKPIAQLAKIYGVTRTTIRNTKRNYNPSIKERRSKNKPSIKNDRCKNKKIKKASKE